MLSVAASFRAAARRQSCMLPGVAATRAASNSAPQQNPVDDPRNMHDVSAMLDEAEEREILRVAGAVEKIEEDNILDPVKAVIDRGHPNLKGFQPGQFTRPKDFSREQYLKGRSWSKRPLLGPDAATSKELDVFHQLNIDPLKECRNTSLLSRFVTSMGKIRGRSETNLTWKNQRRMGKAIRRAKMMGIIPVLSRRQLFVEDKYIP